MTFSLSHFLLSCYQGARAACVCKRTDVVENDLARQDGHVDAVGVEVLAHHGHLLQNLLLDKIHGELVPRRSAAAAAANCNTSTGEKEKKEEKS